MFSPNPPVIHTKAANAIRSHLALIKDGSVRETMKLLRMIVNCCEPFESLYDDLKMDGEEIRLMACLLLEANFEYEFSGDTLLTRHIRIKFGNVGYMLKRLISEFEKRKRTQTSDCWMYFCREDIYYCMSDLGAVMLYWLGMMNPIPIALSNAIDASIVSLREFERVCFEDCGFINDTTDYSACNGWCMDIYYNYSLFSQWHSFIVCMESEMRNLLLIWNEIDGVLEERYSPRDTAEGCYWKRSSCCDSAELEVNNYLQRERVDFEYVRSYCESVYDVCCFLEALARDYLTARTRSLLHYYDRDVDEVRVMINRVL